MKSRLNRFTTLQSNIRVESSQSSFSRSCYFLSLSW